MCDGNIELCVELYQFFIFSYGGFNVDVDPDRLDPELRFSRVYALASAALGVISLCMGIIPVCGGGLGILGIISGLMSLRTERNKTAIAGIVISALGIFATFIYVVILLYFKK